MTTLAQTLRGRARRGAPGRDGRGRGSWGRGSWGRRASGGRNRGRQEAPARLAGGTLTGTMLAARLALRRSRWFWLVWVLALTALLPATASAYTELVPAGPVGRATVAALEGNPTMRAMLGPPYDLLTAGGFTMWRVGTFVAAAAAMMAALGVIRATRAEEDDGRVELLRAGAIGRHAPLAGALVVAFGGCGVLAALVAATMAAAAPPTAGALATGLGIGLVGAVWAGVGAVGAQLAASARSARFIALGALGAAYALRAVADGASDDSSWTPLRWLSPVEWAALTRPYAEERWWVLLLPLALTGVLTAAAFALESRRDHGAGLRPPRPGPARADTGVFGLTGVESLVRRLERPAILGWGLGLTLFALVIGTLTGTIGELLADNPQLADLFRRMGQGEGVLRDTYYATMLGILVVVVAIFAATLILRVRQEEDNGHLELLGSTATSRSRLLLAHVVPALVAPTLLFVACGALLAVAAAADGGGPGLVGQLAWAALALAPGLWLTVGVGTALVGWAPRLTPLLWALLGWSLFATWVGDLLDLPRVLLDATPFAALPRLPAEAMAWGPVAAETALAAALIGLGLLGWRRRDLGRG